MLIGDKTGPAIIAQTYGDVRPEHLLAQAQRIRLTATHGSSPTASGSNNGSNASPDVSAGSIENQQHSKTAQTAP